MRKAVASFLFRWALWVRQAHVCTSIFAQVNTVRHAMASSSSLRSGEIRAKESLIGVGYGRTAQFV
jgi:hypothetical protein